jgi:hypothetical protein
MASDYRFPIRPSVNNDHQETNQDGTANGG